MHLHSIVKRAAACSLLLLIAASASAIDPYPGEGSPVLGAIVVATGGDVIATFASGSSAFYDNYLYLDTVLPGNPNYGSSPGVIGPNWIFENHISLPGQQVDLGSFPAGTELVFHVISDTHLSDFSQHVNGTLDWYTGPAVRNADGIAHAFVDSAYTGPFGGAMVGFEDLSGGGDLGYEDIRFTFTNVHSGTAPDVASTFGLLGMALSGLVAARRYARN